MLIGLPVIIYRASEGMDRPCAGVVVAEQPADDGTLRVIVQAFNPPHTPYPALTILHGVQFVFTVEEAQQVLAGNAEDYVCLDRRLFDSQAAMPEAKAIPDSPARKKR